MSHQVDVSDSELQLIQELIEHERKELAHEMRHTDARVYRAGLRERLAAVETLQQRLQTAETK